MGKTKTKSRSVGDSPKPPITIRSTNVKILDDNIAKLEKAIQASDVSANPSGTAEETLLSTIGIDGKKYELGPSGENVSYDNTESGLTATDTQGAIDEVASDLNALETKVDIGKDTYAFAGIYSGHITGSGNYYDFFVPCTYDDTITGVTISSAAALSIYLPAGVKSQSDIDLTIASVTKVFGGLVIELKFATTQSENLPGIVKLNGAFTFS